MDRCRLHPTGDLNQEKKFLFLGGRFYLYRRIGGIGTTQIPIRVIGRQAAEIGEHLDKRLQLGLTYLNVITPDRRRSRELANEALARRDELADAICTVASIADHSIHGQAGGGIHRRRDNCIDQDREKEDKERNEQKQESAIQRTSIRRRTAGNPDRTQPGEHEVESLKEQTIGQSLYEGQRDADSHQGKHIIQHHQTLARTVLTSQPSDHDYGLNQKSNDQSSTQWLTEQNGKSSPEILPQEKGQEGRTQRQIQGLKKNMGGGAKQASHQAQDCGGPNTQPDCSQYHGQ